jgi:UTP--glucose-1-phosphate uridylyltransferase
VRFEDAREREDIPHVVIHDQDLLVLEDLLRRVQLLEYAALLMRQLALDAMQEDTARIHSIVEKPRPKDAPSNLAVIGRYVLTSRIFELLSQVTPGAGGEIQLTDGISALLREERALAVRLPGRRFDCGSKLGYLQATVEFGLRHPEIGAEFTRYLKNR